MTEDKIQLSKPMYHLSTRILGGLMDRLKATADLVCWWRSYRLVTLFGGPAPYHFGAACPTWGKSSMSIITLTRQNILTPRLSYANMRRCDIFCWVAQSWGVCDTDGVWCRAICTDTWLVVLIWPKAPTTCAEYDSNIVLNLCVHELPKEQRACGDDCKDERCIYDDGFFSEPNHNAGSSHSSGLSPIWPLLRQRSRFFAKNAYLGSEVLNLYNAIRFVGKSLVLCLLMLKRAQQFERSPYDNIDPAFMAHELRMVQVYDVCPLRSNKR